jgi:hypothetical protein
MQANTMTNKLIFKPFLRHLIPSALIIASGVALGQVDTFDFANDDLLLGVQAVSGDGSSQNLFLKLGNTVTIKNNPNQGIIATIGTDLENTYGTNWFTRTDLRFGVIGNRSNLSPAGDPGDPPQEPGRTLYVSIATAAPGAAALRSFFTSSSLAIPCTAYAGLRAVLTQLDDNNTDDFFTALASGATILDQTTQPVSFQNSWSVRNPSGENSFTNLFNIEAPFGTGSEVLVDVQRMVPSVNATYVTTVGINSAGQVRLFTSAPASAFTTWIDSFTSITAPADKLPSADFDKDGVSNLMEFVVNGNPAVSDPSTLPTLNASGANFAFSFNRRDDSEAEAAVTFQYGSDLIGWTDVAVGAASVGNVVVNENGAALDAITVTIPKGVNTKLFGRLRAVK